MFAHVTIFHAALRLYEGLAVRDGRRPHRLSPSERDRYWAELVTFAALMGAPPDIVPDSSGAVAGYYDTIGDQYGSVRFDALVRKALPLPFTHGRLRSVEDVGLLASGLVVVIGGVAAMPILPGKLRRLWGVPRVADPLFTATRTIVAAMVRVLDLPAVGDRFARFAFGDDGLVLINNARALMASTSTGRY